VTLPRGLRDHTLGGRLKNFRQCHLAGDACLIYTDRNDVITLVIVCDHDDLAGGKEKALARKLTPFRR
jgi:addiction module RelE/StbE family toxin